MGGVGGRPVGVGTRRPGPVGGVGRRRAGVGHGGAVGGYVAGAAGGGRQVAEGHRLLAGGAVGFGVGPGGGPPQRRRTGGIRASGRGGRARVGAGGLAAAGGRCAEGVVRELLGRGGQRAGERGGGEAAQGQRRDRGGGRVSGGQQRGEQRMPPMG